MILRANTKLAVRSESEQSAISFILMEMMNKFEIHKLTGDPDTCYS